MAVEIVNPSDETQSLDATLDPKLDDAPAKPENAATEPKQEDEIPEKYRGKTPAQIAKMHMEAEAVLGRQGSELGELRKMADAYIRQNLQTKPSNSAPPKGEPTETDDSEFFANPKQAVSKLLEQHPALQQLRAAHLADQKAKAKAAFNEKHSDYKEIMADPEFHNWVTASKVRTRLLMAADRAYDVDAADELFSTWKELRGVKAKRATETNEQATRANLKAGMVPTGGGSNADTGGKKIYRRADLIRLMQTDPDRYEALQDEILAAYRENRVR